MGESLGVIESLARQGVAALAPRAAAELFASLATGEVGSPMSVIIAGRFGAPEEFGALCAFLSSAQAGYIVGQNILIDGGAFPGAF